MWLNTDMKMIRSLKLCGSMFFLAKSFRMSPRMVNVVNPGKFSTRIQLIHHQDPLRLGTKDTVWDLQSVLSYLHRRAPGSCSTFTKHRTESAWHKLLPSPTQSLYHCTAMILSMRVTGNPGSSHSELLQMVLLSISVWCWTRIRCSRTSCSCRLPNYLGNSAQGGWLPSSTMPWTISMPIRSSCKNPLRT